MIQVGCPIDYVKYQQANCYLEFVVSHDSSLRLYGSTKVGTELYHLSCRMLDTPALNNDLCVLISFV